MKIRRKKVKVQDAASQAPSEETVSRFAPVPPPVDEADRQRRAEILAELFRRDQVLATPQYSESAVQENPWNTQPTM